MDLDIEIPDALTAIGALVSGACVLGALGLTNSAAMSPAAGLRAGKRAGARAAVALGGKNMEVGSRIIVEEVGDTVEDVGDFVEDVEEMAEKAVGDIAEEVGDTAAAGVVVAAAVARFRNEVRA